MKKPQNNNNLPKGWRKVKLGEIAQNFDSKRIPLSSMQRAKMHGEYPYYGAAEIVDYINDYIFDGLYLLIAEDGTVITNGNKPMLQLVSGKFWVNNHAHIIRGKNDLETKYLFYALKNTPIIPYVTGAVQLKLTQENLNKIEIPYSEDEKLRHRIVNILSAFDDKIELNNKIIETLEQMAQEIFKEWFIEFNFPVSSVNSEKLRVNSEKLKSLGYKDAGGKFVDSELGKIPEGWKVGYLGDEIYSEIIKPGIKKFEREKIYLATADVVKNEVVNEKTKISYNNRPIRANMEPILNSVWFAKMINTYKVLFFFEGNKDDIERYILSTGFMGIKALRNMQYYLYLFVNSEKFHQIKDTLVQGAVQEAITNTNVKQIKFFIPPTDLINKFNEKIDLIFIRSYQLKKENQKLAALSDLLLPKLMSGEMEV